MLNLHQRRLLDIDLLTRLLQLLLQELQREEAQSLPQLLLLEDPLDLHTPTQAQIDLEERAMPHLISAQDQTQRLSVTTLQRLTQLVASAEETLPSLHLDP